MNRASVYCSKFDTVQERNPRDSLERLEPVREAGYITDAYSWRQRLGKGIHIDDFTACIDAEQSRDRFARKSNSLS